MASEDTVPPGTRQAHSLLELPSPWLQQLVEAFGSQSEEDGIPSLLALFRSCRFMRDLVLSLHHLRLEVTLPVPPDQLAATQSKLQLACKLPASRVKLHMRQDGDPEEHSDNLAHASARVLMLETMAAAGQELKAITHVNLAGLTLDALVPPWLIATCPHMTSLQLQWCKLGGLPAPGMALPTCNQLTELRLDGRTLSTSQTMRPLWQHQLRSLPNLSSLTVTIGAADDRELQQLQCFSAIGAQITSLDLTCAASYQLGHLAVWFPNLRQLELTHAFIDDGDMEVLLSLKQLRVLGVAGFELKESYAHRPCSWTHLCFDELDIAAFDRLPLDSVQSLASERMTTCVVTPCDDLAVTNRVTANVRRLGWRTGADYAGLVNSRGVVDSQCLAAALAIIPTCSSKVSGLEYRGPVTPEVLAIITQCLACLPLTRITFGDCTWAPGVWPLLLPSLPPTVTKVTLFGGTITEAELTVMCVYACRPVKVVFYVGTLSLEAWLAVWREHVRRAMTAAGHQHVDIRNIVESL